jgi:hypothetical protein
MADLGSIGISRQVIVHAKLVVSSKIYKTQTPNDINSLSIDANGFISGVVKINGVPTSGVHIGLYYRPNLNLIAQATSDNIGAYIFRGLDRFDLKNFFVVILDPQEDSPHNYSLVRDHLTPG